MTAAGDDVTVIPLDSISGIETRKSTGRRARQSLFVTTAEGADYGFSVKLEKWSADLAGALTARGRVVYATPQGMAVTPAPSVWGRGLQLRWFKVAAIAAGVLIAFLVVSSVIGLLIDVAIAALVVATIVLAIKVAFYRGQVSRNRPYSEIREPRRNTPDVDDELSRLKREKGG